MLVDWRGVSIALAVLVAVGLLCALDLHCTSDQGPDVLAHVKGEMMSGRHEALILRRDQIAEQLRDMRVLNKRLVEQGEGKRSRELTRMIIELEKQFQRINAQIDQGK